jgi:phage recombination protein Bet
MENNSIKQENNSVAVVTNNRIDFTPEQIQLVKDQIAPKATDNELKMFLYQCSRTGLDPMTRQIYCIHRGGKMTIQVSIDGFRVIAERSGTYAGQDKPNFIYNEQKQLIGCEVTVYRFAKDNTRYPASVGVAYWAEYCPQQGQDNMWRKMPHTMISKVAEALALRKAFPQDLSGLYTTEEMEKVNVDENNNNGNTNQQTGFVYDMNKQQELEMLLENSTYDQGSKAYEQIKSHIEFNGINEAMYKKIKAGLLMNQLSPEMKANMNVGDATKATKRKVVTDVDYTEIKSES